MFWILNPFFIFLSERNALELVSIIQLSPADLLQNGTVKRVGKETMISVEIVISIEESLQFF